MIFVFPITLRKFGNKFNGSLNIQLPRKVFLSSLWVRSENRRCVCVNFQQPTTRSFIIIQLLNDIYVLNNSNTEFIWNRSKTI